MPPPQRSKGGAADAELRALLQQLKDARGLTYEQLAERASMSRGTAHHYVKRSGDAATRGRWRRCSTRWAPPSTTGLMPWSFINRVCLVSWIRPGRVG